MFEAMLQGVLDTHLGYEPNDHGSKGTLNHRNGYGHKSLKTAYVDVGIAVPRDRSGLADPPLKEVIYMSYLDMM